jgi:uncharacterized protein (TIGR00251 family)
MATADRPVRTGWITVAGDSVTLQVIARPGVSRSGFLRLDPRGLIVALNAPAEKGRANDELICLLARTLKLSRATIKLVAGTASRAKLVRISTHRPAEVATALQAVIPQQTIGGIGAAGIRGRRSPRRAAIIDSH